MRTRYGYNVDIDIANHNVTEFHDLQLIAQAATLPCDCWGEVRLLKEQAYQPSAVAVLDRIESHLYHREEWEGGLL